MQAWCPAQGPLLVDSFRVPPFSKKAAFPEAFRDPLEIIVN